MEVDAFLEGEGERHIRNAKNTAQVMVPASKDQGNFRTSKVSVETGEIMDTRQLTAGTSSRSLKAKAKVAEVSKSENSKHVEETWTPASSPNSHRVRLT